MIGDKQATIENIILTVLALIVIAMCIGCIYAFVRAIFLFIFSQGKEDKIKAAWNSIRYMIMGIILTIVLLFFFPLIFKFMNVQGYEIYSARNIFNKSGELIKSVSGLGNIIRESQQDMKYRGQLYYDTDSSPSSSTLNYSNYNL